MICPITFVTTGPAFAMECKHNLCAWWDEEEEDCAVLTISKIMSRSESRRIDEEIRKERGKF